MATDAPANRNLLIGTKFSRPRRSGDAVIRARLIDKLNEGLERKLTLISAPAGYGKTTLLLTWLETCPWQSVWLSLDDHDNLLPRFCLNLVAAVQTCFVDSCSATRALLEREQIPRPEQLAGSLVNDLAAIDERFIIALDDYHLVPDADIQQFMRTLIKLLPEHVHIAIATRTDPPLSLPLLRASHQQSEIRVMDLRFTQEEAATFFQQAVAGELDGAVVSAINQLAEGWSVGLRLAAVSMQSGRSGAAILDGFKYGASDFVTDYLLDEVLDQQPEPIQHFLLYSSILDRLCSDLCAAVCFGIPEEVDENSPEPQANARLANEYLVRIKRTNLFLTSLESERDWYRYHRLFAENLRYRLRSSAGPAHISMLHRRAACWFAEHGYVEEAVRHALAGEHTDLAVQLVEDQCRNLLNPVDRIVLERWLFLLPEDDIWSSPRILLARGWLLFRQWNLTALDAVLDRIEYLLDVDDTLQDERDIILGQVATLRSTTLCNKDHDYQAAIAASERGIHLVADTERDTRGLANMMRGLSLQAVGQRELAVSQLLGIIEDASPHSPSKTQSYIMLALLHLMAADLTEMQRIVRRMFAFAERSESVNAEPGAHYVAGLLHYERNDLPSAETHFSQMFELRHQANFIGGVVGGLGLTRIHQLRNELGKAQDLIDVLRTEHLRLDNHYLIPLVEAAQAYQDLLSGDQAAAMGWARSVQPDVLQNCLFNFESPALTQARILLQCGTKVELQGGRAQLQQHLSVLQAYHYVNRVIRLGVTAAVIDEKLGYHEDALDQLQRAMELARPSGFIRSFVDAGEDLVPLLRDLRGRGIAEEYISRLLDAFGRGVAVDPIQNIKLTRTKTASTVEEPLTRREEEVLRLIVLGLSNQEISERLTISPHTVKTHATRIYAKLGVSGRVPAIHKARLLGILYSEK